MKNFTFDYCRVLADAIGADLDDNYDADRFGPQKKRLSAKERWLRLLAGLGITSRAEAQRTIRSGIAFVGPHLPNLEWLYQKLNDQESRDLLVSLSAYRALGHRKIKLPLNNPKHWNNLRLAERLVAGSETIPTGFMHFMLSKMDLEKIGYPIELFFSPAGVAIDFIEQQYCCETKHGPIQCEDGDYVVDAGGCWGDTALYFAHKSGPRGRVASFEFLPDNMSIYRRNLSMNPRLAERIKVYEQPVWSSSGCELFVLGNGPGTRVAKETNDPTARKVTTLKIDDLVARGDFPRIDFIKMDIEGAELEALKGSESIMRQFKPKLAITVYHDFKDFWEIPKFLDGLEIGYRFYLRHFTIHAEETVLFASADASP
jgi:FkbM family methyltransferase